MPKLVAPGMEEISIKGTNFKYSAASIDDMMEIASEFTLVTLVIDESGSVDTFASAMENAIREVISKCVNKNNPKSENLVLRILKFNNYVTEYHGFKPAHACDPSSYHGFLNPGGMTALYEASEQAVNASKDYGKQLMDQGIATNALVVIFTDGVNNVQTSTPESVRRSIEKVRQEEALTNITTILIGVNTKNCQSILEQFVKDAGINQFETIENTDSKSFGALANMVSQSISRSSQNIHGNGSSAPISLSI